MSDRKSDVLQGVLDLMVLKTLYSMGPLHGLGIAHRIEQVSAGALDLNEGAVYTALLRLQQPGWITSKCGRARTIGVRVSTRSQGRARNSWSVRRRTGNASRA